MSYPQWNQLGHKDDVITWLLPSTHASFTELHHFDNRKKITETSKYSDPAANNVYSCPRRVCSASWSISRLSFRVWELISKLTENELSIIVMHHTKSHKTFSDSSFLKVKNFLFFLAFYHCVFNSLDWKIANQRRHRQSYFLMFSISNDQLISRGNNC